MAIAGLLASAVGYLWLLTSILSATGVIELPEDFAGSAFYALALVFLGRALRKRARPVGDEDGFRGPVPVPTPPILPDTPRSQPPEVARLPAPPPAPAPAAKLEEPAITRPELLDPGLAADYRPAIPTTPKSSRQLVDEARARWGRKQP